MKSTLTPLLQEYLKRPAAIKDELRTYAECDREGFIKEAIPALGGDAEQRVKLYIAQLLLKSDLIRYLVDPAQSTTEEAIGAAKAIRDLGVPLNSELEAVFSASLQDKHAGVILIRIMELARALSIEKLVMQFQEELMAHEDIEVQSKAALEIGLASKSTAWVVRMLLHANPRVQANAVESLWQATDSDVRNVLLIAARSPHHRVAVNGLAGLYRRGATESIPQMLRMAEDADPLRRASALWLLGETRDPRFLPWLTQAFEKTRGKDKQLVLRALSSIRRQLRAWESVGALRLTVVDSAIMPNNERRIVVVPSSERGDLSTLTPAQFAIWENNNLVTDYSCRCMASPPVLIVGVAVPRYESNTDPWAEAVEHAKHACVALKRPADPWTVVRYFPDDESRQLAARHASMLERDANSPLSVHMKHHRGFVLDRELLSTLVLESEPRVLAAKDLPACVDKLVDITSRASGPRHLFLFFANESPDQAAIRGLASSLRAEAVTLHGFAPAGRTDWEAARRLCEARNGDFHAVMPDVLTKALTETCLGLLSRYEILYRVESTGSEAVQCDLRVSSPFGCGQLTIPMRAAEP